MTTPSEILGIKKFDRWYPGQEDLFNQVMEWINTGPQALGLSVPTGYGKSLLGMLIAQMSGRKTVYLTATKGLQDQLMRDFGAVGLGRGAVELKDIKGQNEYRCLEFQSMQVDRAPCHTGYNCPSKRQCPYYMALEEAQRAKRVVTNYHKWMYQIYSHDSMKVSMPRDTQLLICDEAHQIASVLENFLTVRFTAKDRDLFPWDPHWSARVWKSEVSDILELVKGRLQAVLRSVSNQSSNMDIDHKLIAEYRHLQSLEDRLDRLDVGLKDNASNWMPEMTQDDMAVWTPLKISRYNNVLFQGVPKVILMSAMITRPMMDYLGVLDGQWIDAPSLFPASNTPIVHVKNVTVDHRTSDKDMEKWVKCIDEIIAGRQHKKGIVFTVSYARARYLTERSRFKSQMYQHSNQNLRSVVDQFKRASAPATLVSPAVTTGWDFPSTECEYIVVGKIPYPDTRGSVMKARQAEDKSYPSMIAMQTLVQECGRGTRNSDDKCQVLIVDDTWMRWWPQNRNLAPRWFRDRVHRTNSLDRIPIQI